MGKIAIFGGTFNPVHVGHVNLVCAVNKIYNFDKIIIIPTGIPPHKSAPNLPKGEERIAMCKQAFSELSNLEVSDMEIASEGKSYTIDTIGKLRKEYANEDLFLIVGSDMLLCFDKWKDYKKILGAVTLVAAARSKQDKQSIAKKAEQLQEMIPEAKIDIADIDIIDISSTEVRGCEEYHSYLRGKLSDGRYLHSVNVANRAKKLAKIYGANEQDAYIAGLLHDVSKEEKESEQLQKIQNYDIIIGSDVLNSPNLYHQIAGYITVVTEFKSLNQDILNAIRYHTSGRKNMSLLEKVVYISDLTSDDRDYPDAQRLRRLSEQNLDKAIHEALEFIIDDLKNRRGLPVCQDTLDAATCDGVYRD